MLRVAKEQGSAASSIKVRVHTTLAYVYTLRILKLAVALCYSMHADMCNSDG